MGSMHHTSDAYLHLHRFIVGQDSQGHWVVSDELGMIGGVFSGKEAAVRFALTESEHVPGAVFCAPTGVTLNLDPLFEPGQQD